MGVFSKQLKPESVVVIDPNLVGKVGDWPPADLSVPVIQITKQSVEKPVFTSAVVLGIFCRLMTVIPRDVMVSVIESNVPGGTVEKNLLAFHAGWNAWKRMKPVPRDDLCAHKPRTCVTWTATRIIRNTASPKPSLSFGLKRR